MFGLGVWVKGAKQFKIKNGSKGSGKEDMERRKLNGKILPSLASPYFRFCICGDR